MAKLEDRFSRDVALLLTGTRAVREVRGIWS